jgi:hypothetical protein
MSIFCEGPNFFLQRPNFLIDLAEFFCQELATLIFVQLAEKQPHELATLTGYPAALSVRGMK